MKLLRFGDLGSEKPGILDSDGQIRDLSSIIQDINPSTINDETFTMLQKQDLSGLPVASADHRIGACVGNNLKKTHTKRDTVRSLKKSKNKSHC